MVGVFRALRQMLKIPVKTLQFGSACLQCLYAIPSCPGAEFSVEDNLRATSASVNGLRSMVGRVAGGVGMEFTAVMSPCRRFIFSVKCA